MPGFTERLNSLPPERRAYTLNALTTHLERGGEGDKLHHLLREHECQEEIDDAARPRRVGLKSLFMRPRPRVRLRCFNSWFSLQEREGQAATFIEDVTSAQRMAAADAAREIEGGGEAVHVSLEVRYALILSSINDLGTNIPPALLTRLIGDGVWALKQGLAYARQVPALNRRALTLAAVAAEARGSAKHEILEEALGRVLAIRSSGTRAGALANLASHLCPALLSRALEAARVIDFAAYRVRALAGIIPYLPEHLRNEAFQEAWSAARETPAGGGAGPEPSALSALLPASDREEEMRRALAEIRSSPYDFSKVDLIRRAAPHLPLSLLPEALAVASEIATDRDRRSALVALSPRLAELGQQTEALRLVREGLRDGGDSATAQALAGMAPHLDDEHLRQALLAAEKLYGDETRAAGAAGLSPYLPEKLLRRALGVIRPLKHAVHRVEALAIIARRLAEPKAQEFLESTVAAAMREYKSQAERGEALARLTPLLPDRLLILALSESRRIDDEKLQVKAMAALAAVLPPGQKGEAARRLHSKAQGISVERNRFEALAQVTPLVAEMVGVEEALGIALSISNPDLCARALAGVLPRLSEDKRDEILSKALSRWRKTRRQELLPEAFNHLARHLSASLWDAAVKFARETEWLSYRGGMLTSLLRHAANVERLRPVLALALDITDERARVTALTEAARRLARLGHPEEALRLARTMSDEVRRVEALEGVIPYLPLPLLGQAAASVEELTYDGRRWSVLAELAPRFAALGEWEVAVGLLNSIRAHNKHALAAARMTVHAPPHERARLAAHALSLSEQAQGEFEENEDWWMGEALSCLAPHTSSSQLELTLELALNIADQAARGNALSAVSAQLLRLRPTDAYRLWSKAMRRSAEVSRSDLLANLPALIAVTTRLGGAHTAGEIFQAIDDVGQWWPA